MIKRIIFFWGILACFPSFNFSQEITGIQLNGNRLTLHLDSDQILFQVCTDHILRINYRPQGNQDTSSLVIGTSQWTPAPASIDTTGDPILINGNGFRCEIDRSPFAFRFFNQSGFQVVSQEGLVPFPSTSLDFTIDRGNIYGITNTGQGALTKNTGGTISAGAQGGAGAPFLWSTKGWGCLVDADGGSFAVQNSSLVYNQSQQFTKTDLDVYFMSGSPETIFTAMTDISGQSPLFPKFTLGFLNTEWNIDENELLQDIRTYREKGIPVDAYVLDYDWMAYGEDNYGEFRWGPKFPGALSGDLLQQMDSLHFNIFGIRKPRIHVNTVQGQHCVANNFFVDYQTDYFTGQQVGRLDFRKQEVRDWYWESFAVREDSYNKGLTGYWNDEADDYGGNFMFMEMQRSQYEGQRNFNNQRVWSINRNFYLGAQRYAYAHWSGDIQTGFTSMAYQRTFMLNSINLGSAWWSMDTGGFSGTPGPENYIRWIQFAAFVPVMRVHGTYGQEREPWHYGTAAERIARKYIRLRHALIPYIYSYARENHITGVSLVRPLCFVYPDRSEYANTVHEWFFGEELLVRPVVQSGVSSVSLDIPPGTWVDYWNGDTYSGPASLNYPVSLEDIPILVKSGAIIPIQPVGRTVDDPDSSLQILKLVCFPGEGSFTLYEDDGTTYDYEQGIFATTLFQSQRSPNIFSLSIGARSGLFNPPDRDYLTEVKWLEAEPASAFLDGQSLDKQSVSLVLDSSVTAWTYDGESRSAWIRFPDDGASHDLILQLTPDLDPPSVDSVRCESDTLLNVFFDEKVLPGMDPHSAENTANYAIDPYVEIRTAELSFGQKEVSLKTAPHSSGMSYQLTITNIQDMSAAGNILQDTTIEYTCRLLTGSLILQDGLNGYTGTRDTHISEFFPDNNMGGNPQFEACRYAGNNSGDDKSMLIGFDLSSVDLSDTLQMKAELALTLVNARNGSTEKSLSCHRILTPWEEGGNSSGIDGGLAQTGWATWNSARHQQVLWAAPGGDFLDDPEDELMVGSTTGEIYKWDLTRAFRFWLANPDSNFGVILRERAPGTGDGTKVFAASEYTTQGDRPKMEIAYETTSVKTPESLPRDFVLYQSYPNPFNHQCTIPFDLPVRSRVTLKIFNVFGQEVRRLAEKDFLEAGRHTANWNGSNDMGLSTGSGIYLCCMTAEGFRDTRKIVYLK